MVEKLSIGQQLRKQREERGLTPEQAAYQGHLPIGLLHALESDDYRVVPDPAYLIRSLHEYARLLKLDADALQAEFRSVIRRPPTASLVVAPSPEPPVVPWKQVIWTVVAILIVAPLVFIALSLASKRAAERPPAPPPVVQFPQERAPVDNEGSSPADRAVPKSTESAQPIEAPVAGEPPLPLQAPPASSQTLESAPAPAVPPQVAKPGRLRLLARAVETTWIAVRADGGQEQQVLLQRGQTARFAAETGFLVTLGNAGGVHLSLNGEPLPSFGVSGQVIRDLSIPVNRSNPDALQPLPPGPAPAGSGR
jgi:cytoskeleton protein RodZ